MAQVLQTVRGKIYLAWLRLTSRLQRPLPHTPQGLDALAGRVIALAGIVPDTPSNRATIASMILHLPSEARNGQPITTASLARFAAALKRSAINQTAFQMLEDAKAAAKAAREASAALEVPAAPKADEA